MAKKKTLNINILRALALLLADQDHLSRIAIRLFL